jgi:NADH:ubiquinone oxidoreductase subunit 6 (subunit J)
MSLPIALQQLSVATMVLGAVYICFSRDLFRMTIAFFLETCALGMLLLARNYDFLAAALILMSILAVAVSASFAKVFNGGLKILEENRPKLSSKFIAPILGIGIAAILIRELLAIYEARKSFLQGTAVNPDIFKLGQVMTGQHSLSFVSFISTLLVLSLGLTLLLRNNNPRKEISDG